MKKNTIYLVPLLLSTFAFAQNGKVGIGTTSPQQVLHIDAKKDTPVGSTTTNVSDDVVVTSQGYMGIGTTIPSNRLEIHGPRTGAIKIVDGTQQQNAFLQSDATGVGSWYIQGSIKPIILGSWTTSGIIYSDATGGTKNLSVSITLTPGIWMVNFGATFKMTDTVTTPYWIHLYLSDSANLRSNTTFDFLGNGQNSTGYAGLMIRNNTYNVGNANLLSGSSIINVKKNTTIYVLAENINTTSPYANWNFSASNWENYFYAIPLDIN